MRITENAQLLLRATALLLTCFGLHTVTAHAEESATLDFLSESSVNSSQGESSALVRRRHPFMCSEKNGQLVCPTPASEGEKATYRGDDLPETLLDDPTSLVRNAHDLDNSFPKKSILARRPWSGYYWPNYKGLVANRYADKSFARNSSWHGFRSYAQSRSALRIWRSGNPASIDRLSPAEKYDILMGDENFTLTRAMWKIGEDDLRNFGRVETWTGICDGNAAATLSHPRPEKAISLLSADGRTWVNFYPMDIKGLTAILWSRNFYPANFVGNRCNERFPATSSSGRVTDENCFNTNPGTWHLGIINRIAKDQRGFVMDMSAGFEVWNHVVLGYEYSYANARTGRTALSLEQAMVPMNRMRGYDRYARYRSPKAAYIVGVSMKVRYLTGMSPRQTTTDTGTRDGSKTMTLHYDLELDANRNIIGGEWRSKEHPDFVWAPVKDHRVRTEGDDLALSDYNGDGAVPADWRAGARKASVKGSPLGKFVDILIARSSGQF